MGPLTSLFCLGEGFCTLIVPWEGFLPPSSHVPDVCPGGMVQDEIDSGINDDTNDHNVWKYYDTSKKEFEGLHDYNTDGIIPRAKVRWYEEGVKSCKYFFNFERKEVRDISYQKASEEFMDSNKILSEIKMFHRTLYARKCSEAKYKCFEYLRELNTPKPTGDDKGVFEGKLTKNECLMALLSMKDDKSPGNDGLGKEFYVCFWEQIGNILEDTLNLLEYQLVTACQFSCSSFSEGSFAFGVHWSMLLFPLGTCWGWWKCALCCAGSLEASWWLVGMSWAWGACGFARGLLRACSGLCLLLCLWGAVSGLVCN